MMATVAQDSSSDINVVIIGETGTGKKSSKIELSTIFIDIVNIFFSKKSDNPHTREKSVDFS